MKWVFVNCFTYVTKVHANLLKNASALCSAAEAFVMFNHCSCFLCYLLSWNPWEGINSSTAVEAFELSTERRARERQEYERLASEKEALRALMEEEQRREEEKREKDEITRLRQEQVTARHCLLWRRGWFRMCITQGKHPHWFNDFWWPKVPLSVV